MPTRTSVHVAHSTRKTLASTQKCPHAYAMVPTVDAHALVTEHAPDETAGASELATASFTVPCTP